MIRGILVKDGKLEEVTLEDELKVFYETLGCSTIDITMRDIGGKGYDIVCDDEGLFNADSPISMMCRETQMPMLVGSLFICDHDNRGNLKSLTKEDVARIKSQWRFRTLWGGYR